MADDTTLRIQRLLVGTFSVLLAVVLVIVAGVEMKRSHSTQPVADVSGDNRRCVECHTAKGVAVKSIEQWRGSMHAQQNIGCVDCHKASPGDWDAFTCPESDMLVARHPTPKDCAACHEQQVTEFADSKHAHPFWLLNNGDRAVFEPPVATRNGCEECHQIGNIWPDRSVGECDACHAKHSFSRAVARQPETCGECHLGPDHPHIEMYIESKHGNIFKAKGATWDLTYKSKDLRRIPIEAPVCTTCHIDANETQPATHNVSARLAWESQAPWSYRSVWDKEKLGDWTMKRQRMESVCKSCHAPDFVATYLLVGDLANLQYNEIRRSLVGWNVRLTARGLVSRLSEGGQFYSDSVQNGWDEEPEVLMYHGWHHEGRRFRQGALMMGADYTQWHGIWEMQEDLVKMLQWAAAKGDPDAKAWVASRSPAKFVPFALYDIPGNAWGVGVGTNSPFYLYNKYPDYWPRIQKNVEAAFRAGLLSSAQWQLWLERYQKRDYYLGSAFSADSIFAFYKARNALDVEAFTNQAVKLRLPSGPFWTPTGPATPGTSASEPKNSAPVPSAAGAASTKAAARAAPGARAGSE